MKIKITNKKVGSGEMFRSSTSKHKVGMMGMVIFAMAAAWFFMGANGSEAMR